ncbi:HR-like lesion-inducer [Cynara cardunculus var. scolymus]|uniref:HR-like lesion-inducer n=1 Tax=Cynara cardunculus var. scolymus TaxID=59895 RepID=A0A103Y8M5_CYNCS|nr:HR-like lesion-inducer [Cynara cardunculus var. scolymus]
MFDSGSQFNEFGNDGGSATKTLVPKFSVFSKHVTAHTGFQIKIFVAGAIALKGIRSLLFIFGSTIGAFLLILHQLIVTPILYDFYNYDVEKKEFSQLFIKFTQVRKIEVRRVSTPNPENTRPVSRRVKYPSVQGFYLLLAILFYSGKIE